MAEVRYRVCDNCGAQIKKIYWNIKLWKNDVADTDADLSQDCTSLDLCEVCKFKLEKQLSKIKPTQNEQHTSLRR